MDAVPKLVNDEYLLGMDLHISLMDDVKLEVRVVNCELLNEKHC